MPSRQPGGLSRARCDLVLALAPWLALALGVSWACMMYVRRSICACDAELLLRRGVSKRRRPSQPS